MQVVRIRVLLPARREPVRARRGVDQVHGPQACRGSRRSARCGAPCSTPTRGRPFMHKLTTRGARGPAPGVDRDRLRRAALQLRSRPRPRAAAARRAGSCAFVPAAPELRHLPREWLVPHEAATHQAHEPGPRRRFEGALELDGERRIELDGWRGMVGHNWGSEHAERWIWMHGIGLRRGPGDVARPRPWPGQDRGPDDTVDRQRGVFEDGQLRRLGGLGARGLEVTRAPTRCSLTIPRRRHTRLHVHSARRRASAAGWRYADPDGAEHDVVNCSVAQVELRVDTPGAGTRSLHSHGGVYELGMRERDHGVAIAPFPGRLAV